MAGMTLPPGYPAATQQPSTGFPSNAFNPMQSPYGTIPGGPPATAYNPTQEAQIGQAAGNQATQNRLQAQANYLKQQPLLFQQEQEAFGRSMQPFGGAGGFPAMPSFPQMPSLQGVPAASPAQVQQIQFPNMGPAQQAAFDTAKNQQGQVTASALAGLQNSLAGRGLLGGGYEGKGTTDIVQQGAQALGDLTNQQAQTQAQQALQTAQTGYQGAVQQRAQDIQNQQAQAQQALEAQNQLAQQGLAGYSAQLAARGQSIDEQLKQQQLNQQAMQGLMQSFNIPMLF